MGENKYNILIKHGIVIDGTGNPRYTGDIALKNGKIEKIGDKIEEMADKIIDASKFIVCPGFIDTHSHSDDALTINPWAFSSVNQGITTMIVGNCGIGYAPILENKVDEVKKAFAARSPPGFEIPMDYRTYEEYLASIDKHRCAVNTAFLIGYQTVREMGMSNGYENRKPNPDELARMKSIIDEAMKAGALGMSTGLMYSPQIFASTEEIIELMKIVAQYNGIYTSHIRSEEDHVVEAVQECIDIVERSNGKRGQISHHKMAGQRNWGKSITTLKMIADANTRGLNICCDQYPYNRGASELKAALPPWVHEGGREKLLERLNNAETREKIKKSIIEGVENWENWIDLMGFEHLYLSSQDTPQWKEMEAKSFAEIARIKGMDVWDVFFQILIDSKATASLTIESMGDEDIRRIMTSPYQMFGTDSVAVPALDMIGKVHPRFFGTYPRVIAKYVNEEHLLTMEDAIRRMTSFPARQFGLYNRGLLLEGMAADIVIFDQNTIRDTATFTNPLQYPKGIDYVIVNGQIVIEHGKQKTKILPGKVLRRTDSLPSFSEKV